MCNRSILPFLRIYRDNTLSVGNTDLFIIFLEYRLIFQREANIMIQLLDLLKTNRRGFFKILI